MQKYILQGKKTYRFIEIIKVAKDTTRVVTEINGHRDERSSEINAQKQLKG